MLNKLLVDRLILATVIFLCSSTSLATTVKQCKSYSIDASYLKQDLNALYRIYDNIGRQLHSNQMTLKEGNILSGLAVYRIVELEMKFNQQEKVRKLLGQTVRRLKKDWRTNKNAEAGALLSLLYSLQMKVVPYKRLSIEQSIKDLSHEVLSSYPQNPRVLLAKSITTLNHSRFTKSKRQSTIDSLQEAVSLLRREQSAAGAPCWGMLDAYVALVECAEKHKDRKLASIANRQLAGIYPDYRPFK